MKSVVTGGAGFIGSHLVKELAKRGHEVVIVDDFSSGNMENVRGLLDGTRVRLIRGTVADLPHMRVALRDVSYVFHLAAIASVARSMADPVKTHDVNVGGTINVLLAARDNSAREVVFASSAAIYGNEPSLPKTENMVPSPASPYAASKVAGESYCQAFQQAYHLRSACLRFFNVYGPMQDPDAEYAAVVPRFIKAALSHTPPAIFGDGEQTRDLIYVKDVAKICVLAAEREFSGVINVGSGSGVSINSLARLINRAAGSNIEPVYKPPRSGDIRYSFADISRTRELGYGPGETLEDGLAETVRWFAQNS